MYARTLFYALSLAFSLASGPSMVSAMRLPDDDDDMPFLRGFITRVATAQGAFLLGARLEDSKLPAEIKAPLFTGLFVVGAYGLEWYERPTNRSPLLNFAATGTALAGMGFILNELSLPPELKAHVYSALVGISLWRLCKRTTVGK